MKTECGGQMMMTPEKLEYLRKNRNGLETRAVVDELFAYIDALQKQLTELERLPRRDTSRLDFLEAQGNGDGWVARASTTGRGYRLHNDKGSELTVRQAIDDARGWAWAGQL